MSLETTLLAGDAGSSVSTGGRILSRGPLPFPEADGRGVVSTGGEGSGVVGGGLAIFSCEGGA